MPNAERSFFIRHALRAGFSIEEIFSLTKIDPWFRVQIKERVDFEEELAGAKNCDAISTKTEGTKLLPATSFIRLDGLHLKVAAKVEGRQKWMPQTAKSP